MRGIVRVTFKLHRFEIVAVLLGAAVLSVAALVVALRLEGVGVPAECFGQMDIHGSPRPTVPGCEPVLQAFAEIDAREASLLFALLLVFPAAAGLFLGVPAVSRELERGTAPLPWTFAGSRWRWLAKRGAILVGLLLLGLVPLAVAADHLQATRFPAVSAAEAFGNDAARGGVLVAVGSAAFAVGLLIGLIVGRQLPALILAGVAMAMALSGATVAMDRWSESVSEVRGIQEGRPGDRSIDTRFRSTDGRLFRLFDVLALQPARPDLPDGTIDDQWLQANFQEVSVLVPRERYPQAVLVRSGLLTGAGAIAVILALWLVERRRPA